MIAEPRLQIQWRATVALLRVANHEPATIGEFTRARAAFTDPTPSRVTWAIIEARNEATLRPEAP